MKRLRSNRGFTLIELMIALLIAAIILAAVYDVFMSDFKAFISHNLILNAHEKEKMALEFMSREIQLIGYDAQTSPITADIISAKEDSIQFEEYNRLNNTRAKILYQYRSADNSIVRRFNLWDGASSTWIPATDETVIENVEKFSFVYYSEDNDKIDFTASGAIPAAEIPDIRKVDVTLRVKTEKMDPVRKLFLTRDLTTSIYLRNLGIDQNLLDRTPPAPPTGLASADPNNCGELLLTWNKNSEKDLAGYIIYWGLESRDTIEYSSKLTVTNPGTTSYTLTGLDSAPSNAPDSVKYFIAMAAFDRSLNVSDYSVEVSGDGTSGNDTISNPNKPVMPSEFTGADGPTEGSTVLTWIPSTDPDVAGYRIYRDTVPFTSFPISAAYDPMDKEGLVLVADESTTPTTLDRSSTTFTDAGLIGCKKYYYAITAVNCDLTLVSNDPGDTDDLRYTQTDYRYTSGDGDGPEADIPTGSDTSPLDNTAIDGDPYPVPDISSKAGWKRVFLSLTNPNKSDDPDFTKTLIYYSRTGFPTLNPDGSVTGGDLIPDSSGKFTKGGTNPPIVFDSNTAESPPEPELEIFQTYFFLAISFDLCGNPSMVTEEAKTLSELCGDDPDYAGAPPVPSGLSAEGCYANLRLSWNHQGDTIVDLAGYHVYRSEGSTFNLGTATELTGGAPQWFSYYTDAAVNEGGTYSYGIRATDCYYENIDPSDPNYSAAKTNNISAPAVLSGLKPGRIKKDDTLVRPLTGDVTVSVPTYYHNTVTFFIENTSAGPLTVRNMQLTWDNLSAFLSAVYIGSDVASSNTPRELIWVGREASGTNISLSKTIQDYGTVGSGSRGIPITLVFSDSDGNVTNLVGMREDSLDVSITYVNNSMPETITCPYDGTFNIPLGPTVVGVTQNKPGVATPAWPVPGDQGINPAGEIAVPGGVGVSVSANVYDNSHVGIKKVTLYYFVDELSVYNETTGAPPYDGTNYTQIPMALIAGSLYRTISSIPANDDCTVWYFIVAVDNDGNFDRDPEIGSGAYTYYQQEGNVCNNIPSPPKNLTGTIDTDSVTLAWDAPTTNTDGSTIGSDILGYNIYRDDGNGWEKINTDMVAGTMYTDAGLVDIDTKNYTYKVTALDYCTPTPNESNPSSLYQECAGSPTCTIVSDKSSLYPGDSFIVTVKVCETMNNGNSGEILYLQTCSGQGDTDPIRMKEDLDTGSFNIDKDFYGRNYIKTYRTADYPSSAIDLDLKVNPTDTITIGGISGPATDPPTPAFSDTYCEHLNNGTLVTFDCEVSVTVKPSPCDTTPNAPTGLRITGSNNGQKTITLAWTAPTANTDGSTLTDLGGYYLYRSDNGGAYILVATLRVVTSYTNYTPGKPGSNTYRYYLKAYDTCSTPNEGAASNIVSNR
jgi:prepilin-type N-terminal cleavage/methylation domain-containing protein